MGPVGQSEIIRMDVVYMNTSLGRCVEEADPGNKIGTKTTFFHHFKQILPFHPIKCFLSIKGNKNFRIFIRMFRVNQMKESPCFGASWPLIKPFCSSDIICGSTF